jgi:hypothetical protein
MEVLLIKSSNVSKEALNPEKNLPVSAVPKLRTYNRSHPDLRRIRMTRAIMPTTY